MMRPKIHPKRTVALVLALAGLGAVVSVASGDSDGVSPKADAGPSRAIAKPDRAALALARANIGVLRGARVAASDAIPARIAEGPLLSDGVASLSSARKVRDGGSLRSAWLASTSDGAGVCAVAAGGMICPSVALVVEEGLSPGYVTRLGEPVHVFGVVSDAVRDVALLLRDGRTQSVTVADNFFAVDTAIVPIEVNWIGPDGYESYAFPTRAGVGGIPAAP